MNNKNRMVVWAMAFSGGAALIYELVATQALMYFYNSSSYSVSVVLAAFLLGLALGSLMIAKYLDRIKDRLVFFAGLQLATAVYAIFILTEYDLIPVVLASVSGWAGDIWWLMLLIKFIIGIVYLLVPTLMLGASFPLATSLIVKKASQAGSQVGRLYFWDIMGAILGVIAAGFILIPNFGLYATFIFGAVLNIVAALLVLKKKRLLILVLAVIIISGSIFLQNDRKQVMIEDNGGLDALSLKWFSDKDVLFAKNSPYGEIRVVNDPVVEMKLYINQRGQCAQRRSKSERRISELVVESFEQEIDVLNIGLGCGITLNEILKYDHVVRADIVEINPVVVLASEYFSQAKESLADQRTELIIEDGYSYLLNADRQYDAIIIDIENPAVIHSSPLYTIESFEAVKGRLNEDGIFGLWAFDGSYDYKKTLYKTLAAVFNNVAFVDQSAGSLIFIASDRPLSHKLSTAEQAVNDMIQADDDYKLNTLNHNVLESLYLRQ